MNQHYQTLSERWQNLTSENPALRIRNAAAELGCSELELLAIRTGDDVIRLKSDFKKIITRIESLGSVMALTRNDAMVHEKTGQYKDVTLHGPMGLALGVIDLRIFFNRFVYGYAVSEDSKIGTRHSLQFFDADGVAVHKIYANKETDMEAFTTLVEEFRADDQSMPDVTSGTKEDLLSLPQDTDTQALQQGWRELKDVHHFQALLKKHNLQRIPAYRVVDDEFARPVQPDAFEAALTQAAEDKISIMVFVGSPGVIQIHTGKIENLKRTGPWFNVLDPGFNLHADTTKIAHAWVVRKPTTDGIITSLELFDADGQQLALMFGERENGKLEQQAWRTIVEQIEANFSTADAVAV